MDHRRDTLTATMRLATLVSAIAVAVVLGLDATGALPRPVLVLGVIAFGFAASWMRFVRPTPIAQQLRHHRVATVPVRHPVG